MLKVIRRIREDEEGASAVEYGLLVAAIAAIVILLVFAIGGWVQGAFKKTCDDLKEGAGAAGIENTVDVGTNCDPNEGGGDGGGG
jgi:pilus assembly protein Flp/PilA